MGLEEVPPSDTPYDYVTFRATDLKDIKVEQPRPSVPPQSAQPPVDPAIVSTVRLPLVPLRCLLQEHGDARCFRDENVRCVLPSCTHADLTELLPSF